MVSREQATILILSSLIIASGFVIFSDRNRFTDLVQEYDTLVIEYIQIRAQYDLLDSNYKTVNDQVSEYRREIIELRQEVDRIEYYRETWRSSRDKYTQILGILTEKAYAENISLPQVQSRKDEYHIGEIITFDIESRIPLFGSYFEIYDPEGTLIFKGDPLGEWVEIDEDWVAPFIGQLAYQELMILYEEYPLGNWTWRYRFGELIELEGWFTVIEAYEDVISTCPEGDIWEHVIESITDDANIAQEAVQPSIHPSYLQEERNPEPAELRNERLINSRIWLSIIGLTIVILVYVFS